METAGGTTTIPLNLFTNLCVKRFPKHSFLESTLEILQQFEIKLESHEEYFYLVMGDCSKYSINCVRCKKRITACGSIAQTLFHAPIAMLHHLGMIANFEALDESGLKAMPLLFTGLDVLQDQRSLTKNLWATKLMKNLLLNVSTVSYLLINNSIFVRLLR